MMVTTEKAQMNNQPESCYVPVVPGARWFYATYNVEQGRPVEFFYFREGRSGYNFTATMSTFEGNIVIEQDHDSGGYGGCGANSIELEVPVAVMAEFVRQVQSAIRQ